MGEAALDFGRVGFDEGPDVVDAEFSQVPARVTQFIGPVYNLDTVRPRFADFKRESSRIVAEIKDLTVEDQESMTLAVMLGGNAKKIVKAIEAQRKALILEPKEFVDGVNAICKMITSSLDEAERIAKEKIGQHQAKVELERRESERKAKEAVAALQRKLQAEADEANRKAVEEARKRAEEEQRIKREKEEAEARERGAKQAELAALSKKAEEERQTALKLAEEEAAKIAVVAPVVTVPVVQDTPKVTRTENGSSSYTKNPWVFEVTDAAAVPREYTTVDEKKIRDAVKMGVRAIDGVRIFQSTQINFRG
ncbi:MAG: hypothetical protein ACOYOS_19305 [Syntrophales bacterium]